MCYKYGFDNNIGPMPSWNVESVTNMKGLFKEHLEFNADLSDWDVSKVIDAAEMFKRIEFQSPLGRMETVIVGVHRKHVLRRNFVPG